jgi:hypothetical protein
MATCGYAVPAELANACVTTALDMGAGSTHGGCDGIDTALAMAADVEAVSDGGRCADGRKLWPPGIGARRLTSVLAADGAVEETERVLCAMMVKHSLILALGTFADVARAATRSNDRTTNVLQILTYDKAAGYNLERISAMETERDLLAAGVIVVKQMENLALGLHLLTVAA